MTNLSSDLKPELTWSSDMDIYKDNSSVLLILQAWLLFWPHQATASQRNQCTLSKAIPSEVRKSRHLETLSFYGKRTAGVYFNQQATLFQEPRKPW